MLFEEIKKELNSKQKGTFLKVQWKSDVSVSAKFKHHCVQKITVATVVWGQDYNNKKSVITARSCGSLPSTPQPLPWGHWVDGYKNVFIEHKDKYYLRLYPANVKNPITTTYLLDGQPISKEALLETGIVLPSYWKKSEEKPLCFTVKCDGVQHIY